MGTDILGYYRINFAAFSHAMHAVGNCWKNPRIWWESDGRKVPTLWKKNDYQFHRTSPFDMFCCIFPCHGKLMMKPMISPCDEVYHRMGIGWEKSTHMTGHVWVPIFKVLPTRWFFCIFPYCEKLMRKPMHLPYGEIP